MSKHILSNFLFCFQTKSSFGHGAHKRSCKSIFPGFKRSGSEDDHLPSYLFESTFPFPNSFWWRVSRWFSGANHLARPVITECQQCKMTQSLIHNGKNTLVLNPLKDFVIILIRHRRTPPSGSLTQTTGSVCRSARWNKKPSEMSWVIQLPFGFQSPPRC